MIKFNDMDNVLNSLSEGAFLVSGEGKPNVMTIAWGAVGFMWFKNIIMIPVRKSRYTKEFIDKTGEFTVSIPYGGKFNDALRFCGSKSGRDTDKFAGAKITPVKAKEINSYVIEGCDMYYECRVLYKTTLEKDKLPSEEKDCYATNDMHTMYFAEILASYQKTV